MPTLLMAVGGIWAGLGVLNLLLMFFKLDAGDGGVATFGLMFNFVLFILPGLGVAGIGAMLQRKAEQEEEAPRRSARERRDREAEMERRIEARIRSEMQAPSTPQSSANEENRPVSSQPWTQPKRHKPNFNYPPDRQ